VKEDGTCRPLEALKQMKVTTMNNIVACYRSYFEEKKTTKSRYVVCDHSFLCFFCSYEGGQQATLVVFFKFKGLHR
jgi:hypothetical protein